MPRLLVILAGVFLAARILLGFIEKNDREGSAGGAAADSLELVRWVGPDSAEAISTMTTKPILYDFAAAWCGPCKMMRREVFMDKDAASFINDNFVPARVIDTAVETGHNTPAVAALQKKFSIKAFPTLVVAGRSGEPVILEGYGGKDETLRQLKAAAAAH